MVTCCGGDAAMRGTGHGVPREVGGVGWGRECRRGTIGGKGGGANQLGLEIG